ncbi:MAG: Rne/Rng family ribonuclease [Cyanobacteria bacterium P01_F01_bin.86]
MPKQIVIAEQHRIAAVFAEDQIQELIVATGTHQVSDIYLGTVENVLPGIDAAFVNLGDSDRNGFMHVTDLGPLRLKRTAGSITELVAPQQKVLVQIMKEPTGNKGPRLTGNITLPGRYLVLMPYGKGVNLSRRIRNDQERNRLRALAILLKPSGTGLLVRTEAEGVAEEAIIEDLEFLQRQWENIQQEAVTTRPPALLNRDDDFIQRVLRDVYSADVNRIVTDSHTGSKRVKQHLMNWNGGRIPPGVLIDHHRDRVALLEFFRVNSAIRDALKPRVDLPSGGYIIIEPTEALTVIDVNSGSFTRSATARETVLWTNCEAATEIARQLRLRNVAGVIIVDFIDMDSRRDQLQVLEIFNKALRADKARPQISQLSELGLVELTRKRQGQNIYELFGRPCATCGGLGHLVHLPDEPETTESPLVDPIREIVSSSSRSSFPPPALRESSAESLDPHTDLQELELINHPSYQESRGNKGNRRRRRRDPAPSSRGNGKHDAERLPSPIPAGAAEDTEPVQAIPTTTGRSSRGRNGRVERKAAPPPEKVVVEMTPEEQRVYALMGVSPLVLSSQTVKDARNTVVTVVLPGEAPHLDADSSEDASSGPSSQSVGTSVTLDSPDEVDATSAESLDTVQVTSESAEEVLSPLEDEALLASEEEDDESSTAPRRRRRRRSSAGSDDDLSSVS